MKIKCIDNKDRSYLTNGAIYNAWFMDGELWSDSDSNCGTPLYHGDLSITAHGVFELVEEPKPHPHADLMLKYAMIAQYDDEPWENFEFKNQYSDGWMRVVSPCWDVENEYRLKPQEPKIQAGQVWADKTGIIVSVSGYDSGSVYIKVSIGGLVIPWSFSKKHFLNNFKLQENK